jgi:hypothetical protein
MPALSSWIAELRFLRTTTWLTNNLRKRWSAICVAHRVFSTSRAIERRLKKGSRIAAWHQGMGQDADSKLNDAWKDCT